MSEKPEREGDQDPAPIQHSDAERVSGDEAQSERAGGEPQEEADEQPHE
jgi:hypothetical protein